MTNVIVPSNAILINNVRAKINNFLGVKNFHPLVIEVVLTSAQVKACRATPITIAAAPGPGLFIDLQGAVLLAKYAGTNPFTGAQNLALRYVDGSGIILSQTITGAGFIDQSVNMRTSGLPKVDPIATQAQSENKAVVLHNTGGAEITGNAANDNTLIVKMNYHVYPTEF